MLVMLLGRVMLVRLKHPANAPQPIVVTLFGITTLSREETRENANSEIPITLSPSGEIAGITRSVPV